VAVGLFAALLLTTALAVVAHWTTRPPRPRAADASWLSGTAAPTPTAALLTERYLHRLRTHRRGGAQVGAVLAVALVATREGGLTLGTGRWSPLADVLLGGVLGLVVGSVLAEVWRARPGRGVRSAELRVRAVDPEAASLRPVLVALTAVTALLAAVSPSPRSAGLAATAVALALTHATVLRAVALRGRPALPDDLRAADDAVRAFASRRLSLETLAAALLVLGWQLAGTRPALPVADGVAVLALVAALVLLWRARPYPPRRWRAGGSALPAA
jgi:hypothetical protein